MMRLTADELGMRDYLAADLDRRKYRRPLEAKFAAERFGTLCVIRMTDAATPVTPLGFIHAVDDAVMFAKLAYHGWRAYRVMIGD